MHKIATSLRWQIELRVLLILNDGMFRGECGRMIAQDSRGVMPDLDRIHLRDNPNLNSSQTTLLGLNVQRRLQFLG